MFLHEELAVSEVLEWPIEQLFGELLELLDVPLHLFFRLFEDAVECTAMPKPVDGSNRRSTRTVWSSWHCSPTLVNEFIVALGTTINDTDVGVEHLLPLVSKLLI